MKPVDNNTARIGFFGGKYEFEGNVIIPDYNKTNDNQ